MGRLQSQFAATTVALVSAFLTGAHAAVAPEPLPDPRIAGFVFPESEARLTRWITEMTRGDTATAATAFEKIHLHGWGLWTALTQETAQSHEGQRLRVYETWLTTDDLAAADDGAAEGDTSDFSAATAKSAASASEPPGSALTPAPRRRVPLRQFTTLKIRDDLAERDTATAVTSAEPSVIDRVMGFVKYDPTAAAHIARQQLLRADALNALLEAGATQVPPFPVTALAIKPLLQILRQKDLVDGRYYALKAWPGPPATARPWAPAHWPGAVWIDLQDGGRGAGAVDEIPLPDGSSRTEDTTYPLSRLIYYRISATDAAALNAGQPAPVASAGDVAILVAMHVSGREIARWTWQTFWWSPSPDDPHAPSSAAVAGLRPPQLRGAARNYAMALTYTMLSPDQPYVGGSNTAPTVYAYNPWLEAKLASADLPDSAPGLGPDGRPAPNNVGVQTNCMSCHAQANYNPAQRATAPRLTGARYVDLGAAAFVGTLQVDFLWSLARHAR